MPRRALLLLATLVVLAASSGASAQSRTFYLDRVQLSGAPDDGFTVWRPYMWEKTRIYASTALGYSLDPLRSENMTDDARIENKMEDPMRHQLITYLMAGMELSSRLGINIALPISMYQGGGADPQVLGVGDGLDRTPVAAHDLRIDLRTRVIGTLDSFLKMGAGGALWINTGNEHSFTSDGQSTGWLYGNTELDFGPFFVTGMIGPQFRPQRSIPHSKLFVGDELRFSGGTYLPLRGGRVRLGGELHMTMGLDTLNDKSQILSSNNTSLEWLGQTRLLIDDEKRSYVQFAGGTRLATGYGAPDVRLLVQVGSFTDITKATTTSPQRKLNLTPRPPPEAMDTDKDGFPDDIDMCPTVKEDGQPPDTSDGCPAPPDRDHDGIIDDDDKCPDEPEDKDKIEDYDGCPETDADHDGVLDTEDRCPLEPGPANKVPEKNGCPSLTKIGDDGQVQLLEPIQFETGKSTIKSESFPILDEVVTLMKSRPELKIAVHGHTDNRGGSKMNRKLSAERAAACVTYLVDTGGIAAERLQSEGFGPDKPVVPNDSSEGRAKNRRVEFRIVE